MSKRSSVAFDHYGRSIGRGDVVTYPTRKGSAMWLSHGKVKSVNSDGSLVVVKPDTGRQTTIRNTDMAIKAPKEFRQAITQEIADLG